MSDVSSFHIAGSKVRFGRNAPLFVVFLSSVLFCIGCVDMPQDSTLGAEYVESQTAVQLIDTLSVSLSTVILDPLVTSGKGRVLIGTYWDSSFGKVVCESYAQLGLPLENNLDVTDIFDSLHLILTYDHYYYGDTTLPQRLVVYRLLERIEYDEDESIVSSSAFDFDPSPIGSVSFFPHPIGQDSLIVRLDDSFGRELFNVLTGNPDLTESDQTFESYFKGVLLRTDTTFGGAVTGFVSSGEGLTMLMYTRDPSPSETTTLQLPLINASKQFNRIAHDFVSTNLEQAKQQRVNIPSRATGGNAYLQGGVGLAIRVDFPSLPDLLLFKRMTILSAQVSIAPRAGSYATFDLPAYLAINQTNGLNEVGDALAISTLSVDGLYNESTAYTFDIKNFLIDELSDSYVDPEKGLLLTLSSEDQQSRLHRFVADAGSVYTKLSIYVLSY